tara:strand:+ start:245 stop:637 length:393 start_codon:yes stop_codon:yes gene_type:complete
MKGTPVVIVVCHCTTCQKHCGGPFLHTAAWLAVNVHLKTGDEDDIICHEYTDQLVRQSCKHCGGAVRNVVPAYSMIGFHIPTIKDAYAGNTYKPVFKPQCHLFYGSRVIDVKDGAPKMVKKTPEDGMLAE